MLCRGDAKLITPFLYSQAVIALVRFNVYFSLFHQKATGIIAIHNRNRRLIIYRDVWLLNCISGDDRTGTNINFVLK